MDFMELELLVAAQAAEMRMDAEALASLAGPPPMTTDRDMRRIRISGLGDHGFQIHTVPTEKVA